PTGGGSTRIITIEKGSADILAPELERLFKQIRKNPVQVIVPESLDAKTMPKLEIKPERKPPQRERLQHISFVEETQIVDPAEKKLPGEKDMPVRITAVGDKLIISSEDPEALKLLQELIR